MRDYYFEDFEVGQRYETMAATISEGQILDFAMAYDPQPLHINKPVAEASQFGGLIASGFQTISLTFSLFFRMRWIETANMGSPGIEDIKFLKPLRPGDTIRSVIEVTQIRPSQSRPELGSIWMRHEAYNQKNEMILSALCIHRVRRRPTES
jgi:acyl dehydratase